MFEDCNFRVPFSSANREWREPERDLARRRRRHRQGLASGGYPRSGQGI